MWILVPGSSPSAREAEASTSPSDSLCQELARSATWRGTSLQPATWRRRLGDQAKMGPLYGRILPPSMAALSVAVWISSLRVYHVSPTPVPVIAAATKTSGHSGHTSVESSKKRLRQLGFWSALPTLSEEDTSNQPGDDYKAWATASLRLSTRRPRTSADPMTGSECLFSGASDGTKGAGIRDRAIQCELPAFVSGLPTATAQDAKGSGAAGYSIESGRHSGTTLSDACLGAASEDRRGMLNPLLSAWIMGWPIPSIETPYGCSETEWSRWWERWRSWFCWITRRM